MVFEFETLYRAQAPSPPEEAAPTAAAGLGRAGIHLPQQAGSRNARFADNPIRDKYMARLAQRMAAGAVHAKVKGSEELFQPGARALLDALQACEVRRVVVCPYDGFMKLPEECYELLLPLRKGEAASPRSLGRLLSQAAVSPDADSLAVGRSEAFLRSARALGLDAVYVRLDSSEAWPAGWGWEGAAGAGGGAGGGDSAEGGKRGQRSGFLGRLSSSLFGRAEQPPPAQGVEPATEQGAAGGRIDVPELKGEALFAASMAQVEELVVGRVGRRMSG